MYQGCVEPPGESLGQAGTWYLGGPVVIGGVAVASQRVLGEGLHQPVELGTEAALAEIRAGVHEVALPLPPLGSPVLEPDLRGRIRFPSDEKCDIPL